MEEITFKINDENIALTIPKEDKEVICRLRSEDEFACRYILDLLNNGYLSLTEPLKNVYRLDGVNETLLYSSDNVVYAEDEGVETTEENQENIQKAEWTDAETKLLLDLYEENVPRVGPMKAFKNKKKMWQEISNIINEYFKINRTGIQVENRYKTVLKRKKAAVENNMKSGSLRESIPYEFELNKISALDDSIEPEIVGSASGIQILKTNDNIPSDSDSMPSTSTQSTSSSTRRPVLKPKKKGSHYLKP